MTNLVIVPVFREREVLPDFLSAMQDSMAALNLHILFVNDPSDDGTGSYLDSVCARDPRMFVLHRSGKRGLGRAYVDGFAWGLNRGYERMIQMDCDLSHDPNSLPDLLRALDHIELAVGSRYVRQGGTENWPWYRKLISRLGGFYARVLLGLPIRDFTAGFNGWRRDLISKIMQDPPESDGYAFQVEMKYRALRNRASYCETPIVFRERRAGKSKMSTAIVIEAVIRVLGWRVRDGWGK